MLLEGIGVHYTTGLAYKFKCFNQRRYTVELKQEFFAYRVIPSIIVQNLRIKNPLVNSKSVVKFFFKSYFKFKLIRVKHKLSS